MDKNRNNMICMETGKQMVAVRIEDLCGLQSGMNQLYEMLENLILMWKKEEKLKQHHRPYLEVRREMGRMCDSYLSNMKVIGSRLDMPIRACGMECRGVNDQNAKESSPDAGYEEPISKEELETTPGTGEEVFNAMLDDLLTVMEYVDTQNLFINLMEYSVPLGEVVKDFSNGAFQDMEQMLSRWEQYAKEAGCSV